jgi:hypothetical protein
MSKRAILIAAVSAVALAGCMSIKGRVWEDANKNGIQDEGERGIPNVEVWLVDLGSQEVVLEDTTDENGEYEDSLIYRSPRVERARLVLEVVDGYEFTLKDQGDDSQDSDVDSGGASDEFTNPRDLVLDAGMVAIPPPAAQTEELAGASDTTDSDVEPAESQEPSVGPDGSLSFTDRTGDEFVCDQGESALAEDPPVDILEIDVEQTEDGVVVHVTVSEASADSFSLSVQARIGQSSVGDTGGYQVGIYEVHDGVFRKGRLQTVTDVQPGTEDDVSVEGRRYSFLFPGYVIMPGDTVTARSFHMATSDELRTCDLTQAFPLN